MARSYVYIMPCGDMPGGGMAPEGGIIEADGTIPDAIGDGGENGDCGRLFISFWSAFLIVPFFFFAFDFFEGAGFLEPETCFAAPGIPVGSMPIGRGKAILFR
jgi:hypothetical protein